MSEREELARLLAKHLAAELNAAELGRTLAATLIDQVLTFRARPNGRPPTPR